MFPLISSISFHDSFASMELEFKWSTVDSPLYSGGGHEEEEEDDDDDDDDDGDREGRGGGKEGGGGGLGKKEEEEGSGSGGGNIGDEMINCEGDEGEFWYNRKLGWKKHTEMEETKQT